MVPRELNLLTLNTIKKDQQHLENNLIFGLLDKNEIWIFHA